MSRSSLLCVYPQGLPLLGISLGVFFLIWEFWSERIQNSAPLWRGYLELAMKKFVIQVLVITGLLLSLAYAAFTEFLS
jgi:hypothetical protein